MTYVEMSLMLRRDLCFGDRHMLYEPVFPLSLRWSGLRGEANNAFSGLFEILSAIRTLWT